MLGGPVRPVWLSPRPDWLADGLLPYLSLIDYGPRMRLLSPEEWVAGTNSAYRLDRLRAVGDFRPQLGRRWSGSILLSNEESELAQRLRAAGGATGWVPRAAVLHAVATDRLDPEWFRRRAAWQAVSDYMVNPDHHRRHVAESRRQAESYFRHLGHDGVTTALSQDHAAPDLAHWQVSAVYHLVLDLLDGMRTPP